MKRSSSPPKNQQSVSRFLRVSSPLISRCQYMPFKGPIPMSLKSKNINEQLKNINECSNYEPKSYRTSLKNSQPNTLNQINTELNKNQQPFYHNQTYQINQKQVSTCPIMIYQINSSNFYLKNKQILPLPPIEHRKCKSQQSEDKNRLKKKSSSNSIASSPSTFTTTSSPYTNNYSTKKKNSFVSNFLIKNKFNYLNEKLINTYSARSLEESNLKKNHTKKTRKNVIFKSDFEKQSRVNSSNDSYCFKTNECESSNFLNEINSENDVDFCYDFASNLRLFFETFSSLVFSRFLFVDLISIRKVLKAFKFKANIS